MLLDRKLRVPISGLDYPELLRAGVAAVASYAALVVLRHYVPATASRWHELVLLLVAFLIWAGVSIAILKVSGSSLITQLTSKFAKQTS